MKNYRRLWRLAAVVTALGMLGGSGSYAHAQENTEVLFENNVAYNAYGNSRSDYHANVINSYLIPNEDGTITRLQYYDKKIQLENYDKDLKLLSCGSVPMELEIFGGFFQGKQWNWIIFGQSNPQESDEVETFRIVKYSKDWKRLAECSIYGKNTFWPFNSGNCRMAEYDGNLFVRTCHTMYADDEIHHQANVMLELNEQTMTLTDEMTKSYYERGYVSHSFDQFVDTTDGQLTTVDLGDAIPRAIVWNQYNKGAADEKTISGGASSSMVLQIPDGNIEKDAYAYNATGVSVGGYRVSPESYLVAYNSVDQSSNANQVSRTATRNIYVASKSRNAQNSTWNTVQITNYTEGQTHTPQFVKASDDKYLLVWEHGEKDNYSVNYCLVDGTGQVTTQIYTWREEDGARISDCVPVLWNHKVVWYTSNPKTGLRFYMIDCSGAEPVAQMQMYTGHLINMDEDTSKYFNLTEQGGTWDGTHYYLPGGQMVRNAFFCDGEYTYYLQADGTPMRDRLTYHPDGKHVIYFDINGHEVFSDFAYVNMSIAGTAVDDMCFFDTYGYMYVDTLTYDKTGTRLYYVNAYGVIERNGWFQFSGNEFNAGLGFSGTPGGYGYAESDGSLKTNTYTYDWNGNYVYIQGDGHVQ